MNRRTSCAALAALVVGSVALAEAAFADTMTMWVRASGTNAAAHLIDLWNSTHADKIELTTIPDNQMVTKLGTGVQAGARLATSCHSTSCPISSRWAFSPT